MVWSLSVSTEMALLSCFSGSLIAQSARVDTSTRTHFSASYQWALVRSIGDVFTLCRQSIVPTVLLIESGVFSILVTLTVTDILTF